MSIQHKVIPVGNYINGVGSEVILHLVVDTIGNRVIVEPEKSTFKLFNETNELLTFWGRSRWGIEVVRASLPWYWCLW